MATIGGKKVTTNQTATISGVTSKTLLFTAPSSGITSVLLVSLQYAGGVGINSNIYLRRKVPSTGSVGATADQLVYAVNNITPFTILDIDYPTNGSNKAERLNVIYLTMLPGEELRYSNNNGNTHYINFGTITES